ncbi:MAG TPA: prepilin-type N-terminal cleavage/methylation domain-containing protein [Candidatus Nanopelagicales bacterium]|nr:prepilin-type N-terminal cleavage/methylation domain-containing protein [Candidatus Nanopelagicales bacterium]
MSARGRQRAGYTIIEVMVALGILALGAAGIIALQRAAFISTTHARNLAIANAIAMSWAERLRVDAQQWNEYADAPDLGTTDWLNAVQMQADQMITPTELASFGSPISDLLGTDAYTADSPVPAFCTNIRLSRPPGFGGQPGTVIRADIRVFWERSGTPADCTVDPNQVGLEQNRYGAVHLATSVRRNKIQD